MSNVITVGISDCAVSRDRGVVLVTYALGSCIAVAAHDPVASVGGLLHFMLPDSAMDKPRGRTNPFVYGDTGIALLLQRMLECGASRRRFIIRVAGGAQVLDDQQLFNIGKRNHISMRKALWKAGLLVHAEAVGGSVSRSVRLEVDTGQFFVREGIQPAKELVAAVRKGGM